MKRWMGAGAILALLLVIALPAQAVNLQQVYARFTCVAGETLAVGNALVMKTAGTCFKADADDATLRPAIGIAGIAAASGANVEVVTSGIVGGGTGLTKGGAVYLSAVAGATTQTQPSAYAQLVGRAISATQYAIGIAPPQPVTVLTTAVENLAANADIGDGTAANARVVYAAPQALTVSAVKLYGRAAAAGIDDTNTAVLTIFNGTSTVLVKTFNSTTAWPAAFTPTDLGTVANAAVAAAATLRFDLVNGTTADPPAFDLVFEYFAGD